MITKYLLGFSGLIFLSACVTTDNPKEGGLIGGIAGLSSGAYDRRLSERSNAITNLQKINQNLQVENASLQQQKQMHASEVNRLRRRVSALDNEINTLKSQIIDLKKKSSVSPSAIRRIERRTNEIQGSLANQTQKLSNARNADEIAALEANIETLKNQLKTQHEQAALMLQ